MVYEMMNVLIILILLIFPQCIYISDHYAMCCKHIQLYFTSYSSVKLRGIKKEVIKPSSYLVILTSKEKLSQHFTLCWCLWGFLDTYIKSPKESKLSELVILIMLLNIRSFYEKQSQLFISAQIVRKWI